MSLAAVVEEFLADLGDVLTDPALVREQCVAVSEEFAARCRDAGIEAQVVSGLRIGETPEFPGATLVLAGHYAVLVDGTDGTDGTDGAVYDWTARQFDPFAPVPLVQPLAAWRRTWADG